MVDSKTTAQGNHGDDSDKSEWSDYSFESAIAPNGPILGKLTRKQRNQLQYKELLKFKIKQLKQLKKGHADEQSQNEEQDDFLDIKDLSVAFRMIEERLEQKDKEDD